MPRINEPVKTKRVLAAALVLCYWTLPGIRSAGYHIDNSKQSNEKLKAGLAGRTAMPRSRLRAASEEVGSHCPEAIEEKP
jgi:hypothetical protein